MVRVYGGENPGQFSRQIISETVALHQNPDYRILFEK